jgi:O-antigen/teichoic acid export membrane protein
VKIKLNTISAFQFNQLARYTTLILTGIVLTKTSITQTEIGEYETFTFLAGAVSFFWLNGLQKALLPLTGNNNGKTSGIFSSFMVLQLLSLLAAAFLFLLQPVFSDLLLNGKEIPVAGLLILYIIFGVPSGLVEYYYLIEQKNKSSIIYSVVSFTAQLILVAMPAVLGWGIKAVFGGLVISALLRYLWLWIIFITAKKISYSHSFVKEFLHLGGPLVLATLLSGSAQFVDGFIVTSNFDEETFAIFRYGARELPLALILANALSNAMLPGFANPASLKENLLQLKKSVSRLMHFLFPVTLVLLLISHPVFPVIFNPAFAQSATIFNIYLLLVISRILLPQTILNGMKITNPIMIAALLELTVNVSLSLIFVRFWGIAGVAIATFIAYLFEKVYLSAVTYKKLKISPADYIPIKPFLIYSVLTLAVFAITEGYLKFLF